ncbi:MAG: hypothetical protein LBH95_01695 [Oscillospiraceae bacterium]|jgi:hypothetical protein|nr:hypothetical protein [Oscillospiraceae bacterium]
MKRRRPVTLTIAVSMLLASCACGTPPEPSEEGEDSSAQDEIKARIKADFPNMPPDGTMLTADLTGDGQSETVTFSWLPPKSVPESDNVCTNIAAVIGGADYPLEVEPAAWLTFISCTAADVDGDGAEELLFHYWPGGAGGMGSGMVTLVKWGADGFYYLPVPRMGSESFDHLNGGQGFAAEIALRDNRMVELNCAETSYTQIFPVGDLGVSDEFVYDGKGNLTVGYAGANDPVTGTDPLFDMKVFQSGGRVYIQISQYCWVISHAGGIGIFTTTFHYEKGQYIVSAQRVVPIAEWEWNED